MLIAARSSHDFACCLTRNCERALEIRFCFGRIGLGRLQRDFSGNPIDLGFVPFFLGCFRRRHCFANTAPGIIEFSEVRIGQSQI